MIIQVKSSEGVLLALIINNRDIEEGVIPLTNNDDSLQLLMMRRKAGHIVAKHTSKEIEKTTTKPQKALVITKGKLAVTICDRQGNDVECHELSADQCLFLAHGGYKIEVLEDAHFYEFKNGPYIEDKILL